MNPHLFQTSAALPLEKGGQLHNPAITYHTYGNPANPVVWVCHPFHTHSDVFEWWPGLFGAQDYFNPDQYFIVCANVLGSCFGSSGPLSENPGQGGDVYFHEFPLLSIRDLAAAHELLRKHLKINKIHLLIGGGSGGQQALEWAIEQADIFENLALIATNAKQSGWMAALHETQRMAIAADITWRKNHPQAGEAGMRSAQGIALLAARSYQAYDSFAGNSDGLEETHKAAVFQQEQSERLARPWNAFSFYRLTQAMDTHHVGRNRGSIAAALAEIRARTLVIGVQNDLLFPNAEQRFLADKIQGAVYREIHSEQGHEGFLTETSRLKHLLRIFMEAGEEKLAVPASAAEPRTRAQRIA